MAAHQAPLSSKNSRSLLELMSTESAMLSNHPILCHPLLLFPSIFPSIRVFSRKLTLHIRWPKYWSFSFRISPSSEYSGFISFRMDRLKPVDPDRWVGPSPCLCSCTLANAPSKVAAAADSSSLPQPSDTELFSSIVRPHHHFRCCFKT